MRGKRADSSACAKRTGDKCAVRCDKRPICVGILDLKDYSSLRESDLEQALIDKLQEFLLELGRGFCFVARQKLMRYEDEDFYLDLVFYHSILKCFI